METKISKGVVVIDGHVQGLALTRSLGEQGIPVIIVDRNEFAIARYSKYCKGFYRSPDYLADNFVDFLIGLIKKEDLKDWVLIPCDDHIVFSISKRKKDLEMVYKVITVDFEILQNIINKRNLFNLADSCQLPVIKTIYPQSSKLTDHNVNTLRFPLLLKGIEGQTFYKKSNSKAFKVSNAVELNTVLESLSVKMRLDEIMIQEMIPLGEQNKVISYTAFCVDGNVFTYWIGQKIREHPIFFGTATCSQSIYLPVIHENAVKLIKKLKYTGVCEIEFLLDPRDQQYYLIEINPRTWLWVGLAKACGIDYALMIYNYLNNKPQTFPSKYKSGIYWKNEITDLIFTITGLLTRKISFKSYLNHLFQAKIKALYQKGDRKPFWMFLFLLPYIYSKR